MSRPAIVVENLSKKFRIGTGGGPGYHRLSEMLTGLPRYAYNRFFSRLSMDAGSPRPAAGRGAGGEGSSSDSSPTSHLQQSSDFWALNDVSFEVQPGEVVGIIGRNGAGKSTLLKILSRITEPTSGRFGVRGRVASLLEVGTGFHPELTGRENIYVSGITLGMTRAEIKKRFDEIVDFSGVEKFLDTPVKHYSSGMQVRLGFAVAAHLESEILIVDEVLAVGDSSYQARCTTKMREASRGGRTVLVVSHDQSSISTLCNSCVLLQDGRMDIHGQTQSVIEIYRKSYSYTAADLINTRKDRRGTGRIRCTSIHILDHYGNPTNGVSVGCNLQFRIDLESQVSSDVEISLGVNNSRGIRLCHLSTFLAGISESHLAKGMSAFLVSVPNCPFPPGNYSINLFITDNSEISDWIVDAFTFEVYDGGFFPGNRLPSTDQGLVLVQHSVERVH